MNRETSDTPTEFGVQLEAQAYSQEPESPAPQRYSWRSVAWRAVCLLAGGSLAALVITASTPAYGNHPVNALPRSVPTVEAPAPPLALVQQHISAAMDAQVAPVTREAEYAYLLQEGGVLKVVDMNVLPGLAQSTCNLMARYNDDDLAQRMAGDVTTDGSLNIQQARRIIEASRLVYCPDVK